MKSRIIAILILTCILFCGCNQKKVSCTINVRSSYSGWGEDGHFLGSGEFTEEINVLPGDILCEDSDGHWIVNNSPDDKEEIIMEIKDITPEGVDVIIHEPNKNIEKTMRYTAWRKVESRYVVYDGTNYEYKISFHDYKEE